MVLPNLDRGARFNAHYSEMEILFIRLPFPVKALTDYDQTLLILSFAHPNIEPFQYNRNAWVCVKFSLLFFSF